MGTDALERFRITHARAIERIATRGRAASWGLNADTLAAALHESVTAWARGLAAAPDEHRVAEYLGGLNAPDLVLACACRSGIAAAWEHFVTQYRAMLHAAARALVHDESRARDLADSLYAELYGLAERAGERRSLLAYFHGRSSLRTWLRAIVAQRFVDDYRAYQRATAIGEAAAREQPAATEACAADPPEPDRARHVEVLGDALATAFGELAPRDRMRLNLYYLEQLTLKEIGKVLNEYESSVSRRLARSRLQLRRRVEQLLRRQSLSEEQIRLCYDYALEAFPAELSRALAASVK